MKKGMRTASWMAGLAAVVIGLAASAPSIIPTSRFLPQLSAEMSRRLAQPVEIAEMSFRLLPTPRAVAKDLVIGRKAEVRIAELEVVPEVWPLLIGERRVPLIRARGVALKESAFSIAGTLPKDDGSGAVRIERVLLADVTLEHSKLRLPRFSIDAQLRPGIGVERAVIEAADVALNMSASQRTDRGADARVEGRLYGGTVTVTLRADWTKQWQVAGKGELAGVDVVPLQRLLGKKPQISGRLKTNATFSAKAKGPDQLADALVIDGPFELMGGAYQGVDLAKAGDLTGKSAAGDATPFQQFTGKLQARGRRVQINDLCVRSPKVVAGGRVEIAPDDALSGRLDVSIAKTGGFVGVPVALTGTTSQPSIRPTTGYIVGAAIGTLIMPGIGTGIGASAGGSLEGKSTCK